MRGFNEEKIREKIRNRKILVLDDDEFESLRLLLQNRHVIKFNPNVKESLENVEYKTEHSTDYENGILDRLASLEHDQWIHWMNYSLKVKNIDDSKQKLDIINGWLRKMNLSYKQLKETEKKSDKMFADLAMFAIKGGTPVVPTD